MKNRTNRLLKLLDTLIILGGLGALLGFGSVFAYYLYENEQAQNPSIQCYVSPGQTVVEWKTGTYQTRCRISIGEICVWPFSRKHYTYKVTVNNGIPLRSENGTLVPATSGIEHRGWKSYDSAAWNTIQSNPFEEYQYSDFQTIAPNEYVVMVETRYRLFYDVESTLGICIQNQ